jgi:NAD(P)-dependent dehydrogenase (short-subunit alcohol dehydrogenase family)
MNANPNKICLITGGTSGIGAAAARQLASLGLKVVIVGRNEGKCVRLVKDIRSTEKNADINYLLADLSSQNEIRRLVNEFNDRYRKLDILINNAGAIYSKRLVSPDGLEMTFALNHMSYFLLTSLLIDRLKDGKSSRIIVVSSAAHEQAKIDFEDLQLEYNYNRVMAYARTKLENLLFTYELARRLDGTLITVNAIHPGVVATSFGSNNSWIKTKLRNLLMPKILSPDNTAKAIVFLAISPEIEGITGRYFYDCRAIRSSNDSYNIKDAEKLWEISEKLAGFKWDKSKVTVADTGTQYN